MEPLLDTMGLRGYLFYEFWEGHRTWVGMALVGYNCLYLWVLRPPVWCMFLRRVMSLFLSWGVGSLGRTW